MKNFLFDLKNVWLYGLFREARVKLPHNEGKGFLTCRGSVEALETVLCHIANNNKIPFNPTNGYKQLERLKKICNPKSNSPPK